MNYHCNGPHQWLGMVRYAVPVLLLEKAQEEEEESCHLFSSPYSRRGRTPQSKLQRVISVSSAHRPNLVIQNFRPFSVSSTQMSRGLEGSLEVNTQYVC